MKHTLIQSVIACLAALAAIPCIAATPAPADTISVSRAFMEMPLKQLDLLDSNVRHDMLIYMANDSIWKATNAMGGSSYITRMDRDFMEVAITPVSTLQLKVLPKAGGGNLVCAVYSINTEPGELAGDSQLFFYDSEMNLIPEKQAKKFFKIPPVKEFLSIPKGSITKMKELEEMVPFPTMIYSFDGDSNDLTAKLTVGEYMNQDDYNIMKLFLLPQIVYEWNGKSFKLLH